MDNTTSPRAEAQRRYRAKLRAKNLCSHCRVPIEDGNTTALCNVCRDTHNKKLKEYYKEHPRTKEFIPHPYTEEQLIKRRAASVRYRAKLKATGMCIQCAQPLEDGCITTRCAKCRQYNSDKAQEPHARERNIVNTKRFRAKYKALVMEHYGGKCACCGEHRKEFLQIDHINNDGGKLRKYFHSMGSSWFYKWIVDNNYPDDLRILCANCNWARGVHGYCPHEKEKI